MEMLKLASHKIIQLEDDFF